jgi:hypothetical protein
METVEYYSNFFTGEDYKIDSSLIENIGDLEKFLKKIITDLPQDKTLAVAEFYARDETRIGYTLSEGIMQAGTSKKRTF